MRQLLCPIVVGRELELEAIDDAVAGAAQGHGGCVALIGEPGIGKSRLAREAARRAAGAGLTVVAGRAVPSSVAVPYRPLTEALQQLLRDRGVPTDAEMARWVPALAAIVPTGIACDLGTEDASAAVRGEAVLQLLRRTAVGGALIVLEDLHWADPDTVSVVEYLADNAERERVLCLVTVRGQPSSPALDLVRRQRGRTGAVHLVLERLDAQQTEAMLRACAPDAPGEVVERVRRAAEGIPLLVEELLASPGVPESFGETVRARVAVLTDDERAVVDAAAVLGRHFDWELLPAITGQPEATVTAALARGVELSLLATDGPRFRFRHALTRDAVLESLVPPLRRSLAKAALAALDDVVASERTALDELAADLAERAGDPHRAGALLAACGRQSLRRGALATSIGTLRRAADLLEGAAEQGQAHAELSLVEALALAGRVDEAAAVGERLITRARGEPGTEDIRREAHLLLAQAAVAASRWQMARNQLDAARALVLPGTAASARAQLTVLDADVALASGDAAGARALADRALAIAGARPDVQCHAWEIVGRSQRLRDLEGARVAFERSLATADAAALPFWRVRALHELGTIDMFDHVGVERLIDARRAAEQSGALSTVAVLDLQLAAAYTARWELDECDRHARAALAAAEDAGLHQVRVKALGMLAGSASMRADIHGTEQFATLATAAGPDDAFVNGLGWASRGLARWLAGDGDGAWEHLARGTSVLAQLPNGEPAAVRALWPLLLAARGDRHARHALDEARRLGVGAFGLNAGLLQYAEAVLESRAGRPRRADALIDAAAPGFVNCTGWLDLARCCVAPEAFEAGWGEPGTWLELAADGFGRRGLPAMAQRCAAVLGSRERNPWGREGVTDREADVLRLLATGLSNKEIAAQLGVSPRTVEKHVESLLRKKGARTRTALARAALGGHDDRPRDVGRPGAGPT